MKAKYLFLFVILAIFSVKVSAAERSTIWTFDCSTKPDTIYFSWTTNPLMNRVTFADGIMTINSANAIYPRIVINEPIDVTNFPTLKVMLRTSLTNKRILIQTRSYNSLTGPVLTQVSEPIVGDGEWHLITLALTPNNYTGNITLSFREADDITFASGIFEIDYIILGGSITTSIGNSGMQAVSFEPIVMNNQLYLDTYDKSVELSVYNLSGTKCLTLNGKGKLTTNITSLPSGIYIAKIRSGSDISTKQFIKY